MSPGPLVATAELILASASPRRRILLQDLGLQFTVVEARVEEKPAADETAEEFVRRAASDKAADVCRANPACWILGADTVVVCGDRILGKPEDAGDALAMLRELSGKRHFVHTGFCLLHASEKVSVSRVVTTEVCFSPFSREMAAAYVATGEPLDKAGAYGIQGLGGFLVERINGSYSNVVGLPLAEVVRELLHYKVAAPRRG